LKILKEVRDVAGATLQKLIILPCIEELYIIKEYAVPIKIIKVKKTILIVLAKVRFKIKSNSARRLKVGGAAIFDINTKNHNRGNDTLHPRIPLVNKRLRE
jgi:hypothetical protein